MALKLIASYSKRLGLPAYSSHQFSVTIETELNNVHDIAGASTRLYETLQENVDTQIQRAGFVPSDGYGSRALPAPANGAWLCSDKQKELILRVISENNLEKAEVEALAHKRFAGKSVRQLNKLEASSLIDQLFEKVGVRPAQRSSPPLFQEERVR